jgi:uncharacterized protein (TIGR03905 family)
VKSIVLTPKGVCSKSIVVVVDDGGTIQGVTFVGGCKGALSAIGKLVKGLTFDETIEALKGIPCRGGTSCPDQLAVLLEAYKKGGVKYE